MGAGLPVKNIPVKEMREAGVKAVPIVSSARAAKLIFSMWKRIYKDVPDAVVVEGPKAGGHLGIPLEELDDPVYSLEKVVPEVVQEVKSFETEFSKAIPCHRSRRHLYGRGYLQHYETRCLRGYRWEPGSSQPMSVMLNCRSRKALVACREEDIGIIKSPVGLPGRAIMNGLSPFDDGEEAHLFLSLAVSCRMPGGRVQLLYLHGTEPGTARTSEKRICLCRFQCSPGEEYRFGSTPDGRTQARILHRLLC